MFAGEDTIEGVALEYKTVRDVRKSQMPHWRIVLGAVTSLSVLAVLGMTTIRPGRLSPKPLSRAGNVSADVSLVGGISESCGGPYDQCGGKTFDGITCCQAGCVCRASGDYFSSCQPLKNSNVCDTAAAKEHTKDILDGTPHLKEVAIKGCKAKAAAALEAAAHFADAAKAMVEEQKAAEAQIGAYLNIKNKATEGESSFIAAVKAAKTSDTAEAAVGKTAWQAGDKALKAEAARIKVAMGGDSAFGKLQGTAKKIVAWLGASKK